MKQITFITTCKGRLEHIKQTLPLLIEEAPAEIILVDYGCPQNVGEWVKKNHPSVIVIRITDDPGFCAARARNLGAGAASSPWLFFIDADIRVKSGFTAWLLANQQADAYYKASPIHGARDKETWGSVMCGREAFQNIGGYDEAFRGWGGEDDALYSRLAGAGYSELGYPSEFVAAISHTDQERKELIFIQ